MPLYELFCLAKPALDRAHLARTIQRVGDVLLDKGGVLTNVQSYGEQHLAYDIRRPFEKYTKAHIWQLDFMAPSDSLKSVNHELRVDTSVLRWIVRKRDSPSLPVEEVVRLAQEQGQQGAGAASSEQPSS